MSLCVPLGWLVSLMNNQHLCYKHFSSKIEARKECYIALELSLDFLKADKNENQELIVSNNNKIMNGRPKRYL